MGPIPISQAVDSSGSFTLNVPLQLPHSRFMPQLSLGYNSAATRHSILGRGWDLIGVPTIERVPATVAQDGHRGTVQYNQFDCFALSGQRLIKISGSFKNRTEYRFEIEQWSRIFAYGDIGNPTHWEQYLPDGTMRKFGNTEDSNIKALTGQANPPTRVWAVSEFTDPFSNYISFAYSSLVKASEKPTGTFYLTRVTYGGNKKSKIPKEFRINFSYEERPDVSTRYLGGYIIKNNWRVKTISTTVYTVEGSIDTPILQYAFAYTKSGLAKLTCLDSITLKDCVTGASIHPLKFRWTGSTPRTVFDPTKKIGELQADVTTIKQIIPLDVNGNGTNDIVIASDQNNILNLDVYLADLQGNVSNQKATGSGPTGLPFSPLIYPLDLNGDGVSDILHILDNKTGSFYLTALLSKPDMKNPHAVKFEKQTTVPFNPPNSSGLFCTGDFSGNGLVGLVYIFQDSETNIIKINQFKSDGTKLTGLQQIGINETKGWDFSKIQIVVGDLTGNGADDLFLLYPGTTTWNILWIQSRVGFLKFGSDLSRTAIKVPVSEETRIFPFHADNDAKIGLLFASKSNDVLRLQLLRSTGVSLVDTGPVAFSDIPFAGNIIVNRVTSATTLDVVNVVEGDNGPTIHVIRYDGQTFCEVKNTTQPTLDGIPEADRKNSIVRWADLRGIGRSDCVISTPTNGNIVINSMKCSGTAFSDSRWQPLESISSYSQDLRLSVHIIYAPLSDPSTYKATDRTVVSLINAFASNFGSAAPLTSVSAQNLCRSRVQLVSSPRFIVYQHLVDTSGSVDKHWYKYSDALVDFQGRGWLGFRSISRKSLLPKITVTSTYTQKYPFIGLVERTQTYMDPDVPSSILQITTNNWKDFSAHPKLYLPLLSSTSEHNYRKDQLAYQANVLFQYDKYGNATQTAIQIPQNELKLVANSTFQVPSTDSSCWIVGQKLGDDVLNKSNIRLSMSRYQYFPGTTCLTQVRNWVSDDIWTNKNYTYDNYGNLASVLEPNKCLHFDYDTMVAANVTKTRTYTSQTTFFDDTASYKDTLNLALGLPSSTTNSNGLITSFDYDCLGRKIRASRGTAPYNMIQVERMSFNPILDKLVETSYISNGLEGVRHQWHIIATECDGQGRTTSERETLPDDLSRFTSRDTKYDVAGRVTARSLPYSGLQETNEITYEYDTLSRLTQVVYPPTKAGGSPVTCSFDYDKTVKSGISLITEAINDGTSTRTISCSRLVLPSLDTPGNFTKFCPIKQTNELGQNVYSRFDDLGRPVLIADSQGVWLSLTYDGLSRVTNRRITSGTNSTKNVFSDTTMCFNDASRQSTVRNNLTGTTIISNKDYLGRVVKKISKEETINYTYFNNHLSTVSSSNGPSYTYAYNALGDLKSSIMTLGDDEFKTSFAYTNMGQLQSTTNPDKSSITSTFFSDGATTKDLFLQNSSNIRKAWASFSNVNDVYSLPLTCMLGNGSGALTSQFEISIDGLPTCNTVSRAGTSTFQQQWDYTALRKTKVYGFRDGVTTYGYDPAGMSRCNLQMYSDPYCRLGQLINVLKNGIITTFSYDASGNITQMDGGKFNIDKGWELKSVVKNGTTTCYKYSKDGKRISAEKGTVAQNSMQYDSQGRLTRRVDHINNVTTRFLYDFTGRLVRLSSIDDKGTTRTTVYVSENYDVDTTTTQTATTKQTTSYLIHNHRIASLLTVNGTETVQYYQHDALGSTIAVFDSDGNVLTYYDYDAFGNATPSTPANATARYTYCGKQLIGDLYYFGARFYDPNTGRFLTLDPFAIHLDGLSPSSFNRYAFSINDPINYIDWNGLDPVPIWHWFADMGLILSSFLILRAGHPRLAAAAFGAGFSGLVTDYYAAKNNDSNFRDWIEQLGLGAAIGYTGERLTPVGVTYLGKLLSPGGRFIARTAAGRVASSTISRVSAFAPRTVSVTGMLVRKTTIDATSGAIFGLTQQFITNLWLRYVRKKDTALDDSFLESASWGALGGVILGGVGRGHKNYLKRQAELAENRVMMELSDVFVVRTGPLRVPLVIPSY
ncbi:hypothetical protein AMATHDRAFT_183039 [Amanita thiersii Skay4041]|uniref:Insecticide toxin TcdB middle/N-terminal domain-containing protein n=1 Tax=Amanita thiersii Skay4041 TaxID=703135 RepID=A0A2A9N7Z9_9AGAR|nr:hypothetical protein AMATHDRAFT_183039 [Amanita thiersii Skay4041]